MHLRRKDNEVPLNLVNGQISKEMVEEEKTLEKRKCCKWRICRGIDIYFGRGKSDLTV